MEGLKQLNFKTGTTANDTTVTFNNQRRVTKQIKFLPSNDQSSDLQVLCADSLYGGNLMDGKIKILKIKNKVNENQKKLEISEHDSFMSKYGVTSVEHFDFNNQGDKKREIVVFGEENGMVKLIEMTDRSFPTGSQNDIFMVMTQNQQDQPTSAGDPNDSTPHTDSITTIKKNPYCPQIFASTSTDGSIAIWNLCQQDQEKNFDICLLHDGYKELSEPFADFKD